MRERVIIVFIAVAIGLLITTLVYFLYQQTKITPQRTTNSPISLQATPVPASAVYLVVEAPSDESISDRRSIQVKGETKSENIIIVSTNQEDVIAEPSADGKFSVTISIDAGSNKIVTRAIAPNGEETSDTRVITYSTEEF